MFWFSFRLPLAKNLQGEDMGVSVRVSFASNKEDVEINEYLISI